MKTILTKLAELSPACKEATRLQSLALDGKLSVSQRLGLRIHLLICKGCRRYEKQIHFLHDSAREGADAMTKSVPQKLSDEARERIRQKIQSENK